jgi:hypothetical protein
MSLHAGFGGSVSLVDDSTGTEVETVIANVTEWEFELENEILEAELMGESFVRKEYGLGNATGSITVMFSEDDSAGQGALTDAAASKTKVKLRLNLPGTKGMYWEGTWLIGTLTNTVESNELVEKEYEIEADGAVSLVTPTGV